MKKAIGANRSRWLCSIWEKSLLIALFSLVYALLW